MTILDKLKNEPALLVSTVLAFVAYFGVRISEEDATLLSQLVTSLGPILAGLIIRSQVHGPVTHAAALEAVYREVEVDGHPGNPLGGE